VKWKKLGLVYGPDGSMEWANNTSLQPTPIMLDDRIRVFVGFRDVYGQSRVGYVDVDYGDPSKVLAISSRPSLDIGQEGAFDDNGVVPCAVIKDGRDLLLYYAGYQLHSKVRFTVYSGLAISNDNGITFRRYRLTPILERTDEELLFRVIHSVIIENGRWRVWYGGGSSFKKGERKTLPMYDVRYLESTSGVKFPGKGKVAVTTRGDEYRVGRPYVIKDGIIYKMFYGAGTEALTYKLGYAESINGIDWERKDEQIGISLSKEGWDSEMMAYPSVVKYENRTIMFYNGNNYGKDGFGVAELIEK